MKVFQDIKLGFSGHPNILNQSGNQQLVVGFYDDAPHSHPHAPRQPTNNKPKSPHDWDSGANSNTGMICWYGTAATLNMNECTGWYLNSIEMIIFICTVLSIFDRCMWVVFMMNIVCGFMLLMIFRWNMFFTMLIFTLCVCSRHGARGWG